MQQSENPAGAIEHMPVAKVTNLVKTMEQLRGGSLVFACADMGENDHFRYQSERSIGLVIGSEGEGVSRLVKENCDFTASIDVWKNFFFECLCCGSTFDV